MMIHCKRAYDAATTEDGQRFLVDRLWPRGISRARRTGCDAWVMKTGVSWRYG